MRTKLLTIGIVLGTLVGCSQQNAPQSRVADRASALQPAPSAAAAMRRAPSSIASLQDQGQLLRYEGGADIAAGIRRYPVRLSEEHALKAIGTGALALRMPDGRQLQVAYQRHVEHADGNWSWIGRAEGGAAGRDVVLTFGQNAVFGEIPTADGKDLHITTSAGHTWLVDGEGSQAEAAALVDDFVVAPAAVETTDSKIALAMAAGKTRATAQASAAAADASPTVTVDLLLGYTKGFADRLGGSSVAVTRLNHLVDIANQAYANSAVESRLRLVDTIQVDYPDATTNRSALFDLTGVECTSGTSRSLPDSRVNCTTIGRPAALQPLADAREIKGADVVSLVRTFQSPENQSCGLGWLLGAGQAEVTSTDAAYAFNVVSDSGGNQFPDNGATCREDTLAHEIGHNMGLQHDRQAAAGADDTNGDGDLLDPEEFGRYPYSFGHSTDLDGGNFFTVMSVRRSGQVGYRVFSNPEVTSCGGFPCGVADVADNARALRLTMPVVAAFRTAAESSEPAPQPLAVLLKQLDVNGNGKSDLMFFRHDTGRIGVWFMSGNAITAIAGSSISGAYRVVDGGDFNGDGRDDLLLTSAARDVVIGLSNGVSHAYTVLPFTYASGVQLVGAADINGDGRADVLVRNMGTGALSVWYMDGTTRKAYNAHAFSRSWTWVAGGDMNGDGREDLLWVDASRRVFVSLSNGTSFSTSDTGLVHASSYGLSGLVDVNGDNRADIVLHSPGLNRMVVWYMSGPARYAYNAHLLPSGYAPMGKGDFDGNLKQDVVLQNAATHQIVLMLSSGSAFASSSVSTVPAASAKLMDNPAG